MCLDLNGFYLPIHYWYSRTRLIVRIEKGPTEQINKPPYPISQYLPSWRVWRQQDSCCLERSRESATSLPWWGLKEEEVDLPEVKEMDKATSDKIQFIFPTCLRSHETYFHATYGHVTTSMLILFTCSQDPKQDNTGKVY